ncbi:hypothetical protein BC835DRAFT_1311423 [Cytidiella melzeri]|nr:hypothetical protein BC835DRAFT_1311423 [Cytidiella melzeri]
MGDLNNKDPHNQLNDVDLEHQAHGEAHYPRDNTDVLQSGAILATAEATPLLREYQSKIEIRSTLAEHLPRAGSGSGKGRNNNRGRGKAPVGLNQADKAKLLDLIQKIPSSSQTELVWSEDHKWTHVAGVLHDSLVLVVMKTSTNQYKAGLMQKGNGKTAPSQLRGKPVLEAIFNNPPTFEDIAQGLTTHLNELVPSDFSTLSEDICIRAGEN